MATVSTTYGTYLVDDLFDPQVIGDRINKKLFDAIRFSPLATRYDNLEGRPGPQFLFRTTTQFRSLLSCRKELTFRSPS